MVKTAREEFLSDFSQTRYEEFLTGLQSVHPGAIEFRVAETPIFIDRVFKNKLLDACEAIVDIITGENFIAKTEDSIPPAEKVKGVSAFPHMIAFDFGICENDEGMLEPKLIEMQGFPTLFGFQPLVAEYYAKYFKIPENYSPYLSNLNKETYYQLLRKTILGNHSPEEVILLEIFPHQQKTRIDFYCTEDITGIQTVCLTELIKEGKELFYLHNGNKTKIKRVYNRIIFDELNAIREKENIAIDLTEELEVEWVPHPDWFYRISKFTLPFIHHPYVPQTFFLNELHQQPEDLSNYVLKPLFSFAGQGVVIDVTHNDIEAIGNPAQWILQEKVKYAEVIKTTNTPAKAEIRMMYVWEEGTTRPKAVMNLARLSKGKMIGVRYNAEHDWVGGSICFFEK